MKYSKIKSMTRRQTYTLLDTLNENNSDILTDILKSGWIGDSILQRCFHYRYIDGNEYMNMRLRNMLVNRCLNEWLNANGYRILPF